MTKNSLLSKLWDNIDMTEGKCSEEEKRLSSKLEALIQELSTDFSENQVFLLNNLVETYSDLSYLERKEAFIKGVKFATGFLLEAMD